MARILDPDEDENALDLSELCCPKCGCNAVKVIKWPRPGSWFGMNGKAACEFCKIHFAVRIDEPMS